MRTLAIGGLAVFGLGVSRCDVNQPLSPDDAVIDAAVSSIGGIMDDTVGSGDWAQLGGDGGCSRTGSCDTTGTYAISTVSYYQCSGSENELNGIIKLQFNNNTDCELAVGETIWRTGTTTTTGLVPGSVAHSSLNFPTYYEYSDTSGITVVGGGSYVTKVSNDRYVMNILGNNVRRRLRNGTFDYDVSVSTTEVTGETDTDVHDISIQGDGSRGSRSASGTLMVYHNTNDFHAKMVLDGVSWGESNCCFPTSGSISLTYFGSKSGSGTMTFNGCGTGKLVDDSGSKSIALKYCQ